MVMRTGTLILCGKVIHGLKGVHSGRRAVDAGTSKEVIELYAVYISDFDFLKEGKTIYHVEKVLR